MGEMMGSSDIQKEKLAADHAVDDKPDDTQGTDAPDGKFKTDVDGVFADGDKGGVPVFKVSAQEFYNNMKTDRRRLRFTSDAAKSYHRNTKYRRPFYIQNADDGYMYKIK